MIRGLANRDTDADRIIVERPDNVGRMASFYMFAEQKDCVVVALAQVAFVGKMLSLIHI